MFRRNKREQSTDESAQPSKPAAYYDIEMERRRWRRVVWTAVIATSVVSLVVSTWSSVVALAALRRPVPVVAFDAEGRPIVFDETVRPGREVTAVRIRHFVKTFVGLWICVDSTRHVEDTRQALNLMTRPLQEWVEADGTALEFRRAHDDGNSRSRAEGLEIRVGEFDAGDRRQMIGVYAWGKIVAAPIRATVRGAEPQSHYVFAELHLKRVDVTDENPYGLLVDYLYEARFADAKSLELEIMKRRKS